MQLILNNIFVRLLVTLCAVFMSAVSFADAQMDAAAASVVTEIQSWYAATGFVSLIGQGLALAAIIVVGYIWLKATIFSST